MTGLSCPGQLFLFSPVLVKINGEKIWESEKCIVVVVLLLLWRMCCEFGLFWPADQRGPGWILGERVGGERNALGLYNYPQGC